MFVLKPTLRRIHEGENKNISTPPKICYTVKNRSSETIQSDLKKTLRAKRRPPFKTNKTIEAKILRRFLQS